MLRKLLYVFTKEYRDEVRYYEFLRKVRPRVKLKSDAESIDSNIERLRSIGFKSNCHIKVGQF